MSYLTETEFLLSLRPKDRWNKLTYQILQKSHRQRIQVNLLGSAIQELRAVLYSQGKTFREVYSSFIYLKRKLAQYAVLEEPTNIDDYILADKLREDHPELTYFDSIHAASALRRNATLVTNDSVYGRIEVGTITFSELARAL